MNAKTATLGRGGSKSVFVLDFSFAHNNTYVTALLVLFLFSFYFLKEHSALITGWWEVPGSIPSRAC